MNQEESEHNEVDGMKKGVDSTGEVIHTYEICNALIVEGGSNQMRGLLLGGGVWENGRAVVCF